MVVVLVFIPGPSLVRSCNLLDGFERNKFTGLEPVRRIRKPATARLEPRTSKSEKAPRDGNENSAGGAFPFIRRIPTALIARSAIAVLALGFVDAGYSGDWSRIGAISKETEDVLKLAAYFVVPLCICLIFTVSQEKDKEIP